jgi:hypothetical protein
VRIKDLPHLLWWPYLQAMARAVEESAAVVVCVSKR